jgi:hypothetical protein
MPRSFECGAQREAQRSRQENAPGVVGVSVVAKALARVSAGSRRPSEPESQRG